MAVAHLSILLCSQKEINSCDDTKSLTQVFQIQSEAIVVITHESVTKRAMTAKIPQKPQYQNPMIGPKKADKHAQPAKIHSTRFERWLSEYLFKQISATSWRRCSGKLEKDALLAILLMKDRRFVARTMGRMISDTKTMCLHHRSSLRQPQT